MRNRPLSRPTEEQTIQWANPQAEVLGRLTRHHDMQINQLVNNTVKVLISVTSNTNAPPLQFVATDKIESGMREYTMGPIPEIVSDSELLATVNREHCSHCSSRLQPCQATVERRFLSTPRTLPGSSFQAPTIRQDIRCLVISKPIPVPLSRAQVLDVVISLAFVLVGICVLMMAVSALRELWRGYEITWLGVTL